MPGVFVFVEGRWKVEEKQRNSVRRRMGVDDSCSQRFKEGLEGCLEQKVEEASGCKEEE